MLQNELPGDLITEVVVDIILGGWLLEELIKFLEFSSSSSEVSAIITSYK